MTQKNWIWILLIAGIVIFFLFGEELKSLFGVISPLDTSLIYLSFNGNLDNLGSIGNILNIQSTASFSTGYFEQGLSFDGVDDYVVMDKILDDIGSISLWVYPATNKEMFAIWGGNPLGNGWGAENELHLGSSLGADGTFQLYYISSNECNVKSSTNFAQNLNTWYHLVVTYDNAECKLYVNGNLEATDPARSPDKTGWGGKIYLGKPGINTRFWSGRIDEVAIWNRVLTQGEITALYSSSTYEDIDISPVINVIHPVSNYYSEGNTTIPLLLNLNEKSYCEYSLDNGKINYTMDTTNDLNFNSTLILDIENYTVTFYCNDTANNLVSLSTQFSINKLEGQPIIEEKWWNVSLFAIRGYQIRSWMVYLLIIAVIIYVIFYVRKKK